MSYATKKAALIRCLERATGLPNGQVIWTDQNMGRPSKPYISVNVTNMKNRGREQVLSPDSVGKATIVTEKEFYLALMAFSDAPPVPTAIDTEQLLINLSDWLFTEEAREVMEPEGLVYVDTVSGPNCVSTAVNSNWETRSMMDVLMRMAWTMEDEKQGLIESVNSNVIVKNVDGSTIISEALLVGTSFSPVETILTGITIDRVDTLFQTVSFHQSTTLYALPYSETTVISIDGDTTKLVTDLLVGDTGSAVSFEYLSNNYLKSITVTRP